MKERIFGNLIGFPQFSYYIKCKRLSNFAVYSKKGDRCYVWKSSRYYDSVAKKLNDSAATAVDQGRRKVLKSEWASCYVAGIICSHPL